MALLLMIIGYSLGAGITLAAIAVAVGDDSRLRGLHNLVAAFVWPVVWVAVAVMLLLDARAEK